MKWLTQYWAVIGGIKAVAIVFYIIIAGGKITDIDTLLWLHLVTLLIHQFEEYVYPGGFKKFFNHNIYNKNPIIRFPLNDAGILIINIGLGWSAYLISAINGDNLMWLATGLLCITLLNGILHTMLFIYQRKYNPGFLTALFIMIPFASYMLIKFESLFPSDLFITGIYVFLIGAVLIPIFIFLTNLLQEKDP